jgi:hypothetical protein
MDGWKDGWVGGWAGGRTDGRTDGRMDGRIRGPTAPIHVGLKEWALCALLLVSPRHLQRRSTSDDVRDLYQ